MEIFRVAALSVAGISLAIFLKQVRPEYALYISLATGVLILLLASGRLTYVFDMLFKLVEV